MRLTFIGANHEVTGSAHFLEVGGKHILIDYGMEQGINVFENIPLPIPASQIDYVLLTHAHIDHSGLLPLLYAQGYRGSIYTTEATADLCGIMLRDSAHIQTMEAEWKSRKAKRSQSQDTVQPLYTMADAEAAIRHIIACPYQKKIHLCNEISIRFTDIGHLLGSASIEIWLSEQEKTKKIVFSGDIGNTNQPLIRDPSYTDEADYVVMESTYGDRNHPASKFDYVKELAAILQETFDRGGNVVIPSFAVGRTQEILYFLRQIKATNLVHGHDGFPVFVDSPLAVEATGIFKENQQSCFDEEALALLTRGVNPLSFPGLKLYITSEESKSINFIETPKVIISASGMCDAGRVRHHLKHNLWRPECTILFVGYQSVGTLGRILADHGNSKEPLNIKLFGETIAVKAQILQMRGLSGHADRDGLTKWVNHFSPKPRRVFLVHGEDQVCQAFGEYLRIEYHLNPYAPYSGTVFNLLSNQIEYEALPLSRKKKSSTTTPAYTRLLRAAENLLSFAQGCVGRANKDLAKMADQVTALHDKWTGKTR
ncbi:MAG: MBL fold metallo-hydrolase [Clostridium sp.]|jgi:metallo-beta-lactamase family protein|nr:MBL fold metallo-hydrolase [Clostridium sp.]